MLHNEMAKEVESGKKEKKNHCFILDMVVRNVIPGLGYIMHIKAYH